MKSNRERGKGYSLSRERAGLVNPALSIMEEGNYCLVGEVW